MLQKLLLGEKKSLHALAHALGRVQRGDGGGCGRLSLSARRLGSFDPAEARPGSRTRRTFPRMLQKPPLSVARREISLAPRPARIHLETTSAQKQTFPAPGRRYSSHVTSTMGAVIRAFTARR